MGNLALNTWPSSSTVPLSLLHHNKTCLDTAKLRIEYNHLIKLRNVTYETCEVKESCEVKSLLERSVKRALLRNGIPALYEPMELLVNMNSKRQIYPFDYLLTEHYYVKEGKPVPVILEPHGVSLITEPYIAKLKNIGKTYGVHIILISYYTPDYACARPPRNQIKECVGEFWEVWGQKKTTNQLTLMLKHLAARLEKREDNAMIPIMNKLKQMDPAMFEFHMRKD